jgi:hypothetical protein
MGELSMQPDCRFIISVSSFLSSSKHPEMYPFAIKTDASLPHLRQTVPTHSLEPRGVVILQSTIMDVLLLSAVAQIVFPIIKRIVVLMVNFPIKLKSHDGFVQEYVCLPIPHDISDCVKGLGSETAHSVPVPLQQPIVVLSIYYGILLLRKWNKTVGWVRRLDDFVSLYTGFHGPTSHGALIPAAV